MQCEEDQVKPLFGANWRIDTTYKSGETLAQLASVGIRFERGEVPLRCGHYESLKNSE